MSTHEILSSQHNCLHSRGTHFIDGGGWGGDRQTWEQIGLNINTCNSSTKPESKLVLTSMMQQFYKTSEQVGLNINDATVLQNLRASWS